MKDLRWVLDQVGQRQGKNETWEECYERSQADGFWASLDEMVPAPNLTALGYKRYDTPEEINREIAVAARLHAKELAEQVGVPASYAEAVPLLCRAERLASLQVHKPTPHAHTYTHTQCVFVCVCVCARARACVCVFVCV